MPLPKTDMASWPKGSDEFVEAFAKGLAVLTSFGEGAHELTISDVAQRTGLPRAGVRRLLHTLVALDLAIHHDGRFALTPRVLRLGYAYLSSLELRDVAQPLIEQLSRKTSEIVAISVLDGTDIVYVARTGLMRVLARNVSVGSRLPAFCTSMGRVLLASLGTEEAAQTIAESDLAAYTRYTKRDPAQILAEIETVRHQGWSVVSQELELGVCGLAAPILDAEGKTIAAINISTNLSRHSRSSFVKEMLPLLRETAAALSSHSSANRQSQRF